MIKLKIFTVQSRAKMKMKALFRLHFSSQYVILTCSGYRWACRHALGRSASPEVDPGWEGWSLGRHDQASLCNATASGFDCTGDRKSNQQRWSNKALLYKQLHKGLLRWCILGQCLLVLRLSLLRTYYFYSNSKDKCYVLLKKGKH